ncbi:hypothetical protein MNBD_IGNAVI01-1197 [hydrothermal vent metagenome]|uniref:Methyltransferase domain-containing protein n=1 Tax=hydrothermal vent metagenome TaxID=652676 RepID=A0A3B1BN12_9ZZZZ
MKILERKLEKSKTITNYKKVVWFYDFWSWLTESKAAKYVIKFAEINDGETILEVACGTGVVFEQIVKLNPSGKNIGIDLSPDMLNKAKQRLKKTIHNNYKLKEGDTLRLDFEDNKFDLIVNNFMVDLMPFDAFDKIAEEFHRVTKPNGKVVISTFSFCKKKINKLWLWVAKKFPDILTGCRPVSLKRI